MTDTSAPAPAAAPSKGYRILVMLLLFLVYAFNFLDRQIISILAIPIQAELDLSDRQLGLLGGLAFAFLYSTLGVPIAWLADRTNRTWIITGALAIWSGFTVLCGYTQNFTQLFLARVGVGIGEAGGVAPSYSLIADYFPPKSRARALAFYSLGIPIGSAFGVIAGSQIAGGAISDSLDWRAAFIIVGIAGLVLVPIFKLVVREPARGQLDTVKLDDTVAKPSFGQVLGVLAKKPTFWFLTFGAACSSMMGYGVFFWLPSFFARSFDLDIIQTGWLFGSILFIGGTAGIVLGGVMSDLFGKRTVTAYARVPGIAFLLTTPLYIAGVLAPSPALSVILFLVPTALGLAWLGPTLSAFQNLVPASMRTTASSIFLLINNLIGIAGGIYVLGELSTLLAPTFGDASLKYSIIIGSMMYLIAGTLFLIAARSIAKDWEG
ncbi:spinster family MFS transporter [Hyphobacterium marinum]|uniref:MFS transporter n=1 Tax=Hyphobacterium marinum TaxID=3116574 RepID=A0ABU7LVU6_9PROT|nr:MFS transporter [Hyphobacterium sp. Y6023]MEE2565679.1 MFS transporter [Hyphobacterium sp. Y6023]